MSVPAGVPIGGPFELNDEKGHPVTDADYRGRWMLVFFGYTNCPDECPLTLQKMATTLQDLGPLADRIAPLFITVDPKRDTPERLGSYLGNFDTRITGLTGGDQQIAAVAKAYWVYYEPRQNDQSGADLVKRKAECALFAGCDAGEADRSLAHMRVVAESSGASHFKGGTGATMHDMGSTVWGMGLV
ncbi:MAG: SCO family protein [Stellaceae bacterium]